MRLVLKEKLPIPDEVKFRTFFYTSLFEDNPYWNDRTWLTIRNVALQSRFDILKNKYNEIEDKLYPKKDKKIK